MKRKFTIRFNEAFLPTPRHRNLRYRERTEQVEIEITDLTSAEAPVAFRQLAPRSLSRLLPVQSGRGGRDHRSRLDYHYHDGKLYTRVRLSHFCSLSGGFGRPELKDREATIRDIGAYQYGRLGGFDEELAKLRQHMGDYRIIDGHLCDVIGEPRYVVMTFGLGGNHGIGWGTSLSVDHGFNPNILTDRYYRIDQEAEANKAGLAIALRRGDTKAKGHFSRRLYDRFEILLPEAIQMRREDHGPDDDFTKLVAGFTETGLHPTVAAFGLLGAVFG